MDDARTFHPPYTPTSGRPLLGMTILVVEDSLFACDAMRLMCLHSGARIRRADCLRSARRHLQVYRPSAVIVDLGLPDGSGADLITELHEAVPRVAVILGTSGDDGAEDLAMAAGADAFLAKPVTHLGRFQETILALLPPERQPTGPRRLRTDIIHADPIAYRDDMSHVASLLDEDADGPMLDYVAQFLSGVARAAGDRQLVRAAENLAQLRARGDAATGPVARIAGLLQERIAGRAAM
ncbi:response regulator [Roseovarius sp. SCSIO 43702]|uniref:response regulator n=1 Tax=Roseovarius sp. SCSIO 43702 TaxID=2823043 RepID=UPI001C73B180|nr:response regulator [Roseovarius sp. SCSIO 43702]QYX57807.1 response regulator [Roseovarius sp. SCSIO 43702]